MFKNKKGFTLIELMIVITVIAILVSIALVAFTQVQKQARDAKRRSEAKSLATAIQAYNVDNKIYPPNITGATLAPKYIGQIPTAPAGTAGSNDDYTYVVGSTNVEFGLCVTLENTASMMYQIGSINSGGRDVTDAPCTTF